MFHPLYDDIINVAISKDKNLPKINTNLTKANSLFVSQQLLQCPNEDAVLIGRGQQSQGAGQSHCRVGRKRHLLRIQQLTIILRLQLVQPAIFFLCSIHTKLTMCMNISINGNSCPYLTLVFLNVRDNFMSLIYLLCLTAPMSNFSRLKVFQYLLCTVCSSNYSIHHFN